MSFIGWFILYLVADQKTAPNSQPMGKVVDDIGQKVQVSTDLFKDTKKPIEVDYLYYPTQWKFDCKLQASVKLWYMQYIYMHICFASTYNMYM